jgi:hypothetical protein
MQYMGLPIASSRTQSISRETQFTLYLDLTDEQLEKMKRGTENRRLSFMTSVRVSGKGQGWSWGEMHTKLTARIAEDARMELKKTSERRGMKDRVFVADVNRAKRKLVAGVMEVIGVDDVSLLPFLESDKADSVFAMGLETMEVKDLQSRHPGFDAAIAEYLPPIIEQELTSAGRTELKSDFRRETNETTASGGGGFSLGFIKANGSATSTDSIVKGVEKTAGVKFQKDTVTGRYALTDVSVHQVRETTSFADVHLHKRIIVEGAVAQYWLTQPPISVGLHAASRNEWLSLERRFDTARQASADSLKKAKAELSIAREKFDAASAQKEMVEKELAALKEDRKRYEGEIGKLKSALKNYNQQLAVMTVKALHSPFPLGYKGELKKLDKKIASTTKALKGAKSNLESVNSNLSQTANRVAAARTECEKAGIAVRQAEALHDQARAVHLQIVSQREPA